MALIAVDVAHRQVQAVAVHGTTFVAGSDDGTIQRRSLITRDRVADDIIESDKQPIWSMAFSPNGDRLAVAGNGDTVRLYNMVDSHAPTIRIPHYGGVWTVAFSSSGNRLATGGVDDIVRVWDTATGEKVTDLITGDRKDVKAVAFVGEHLVSVGDDGTVRLWNIPALPPAMPAHDDPVIGVAFRDDRIFSVTAGGMVRQWRPDETPASPAAPLQKRSDSVPVVETYGHAVAFASSRGTVDSVDLVDPGRGRPDVPAVLPQNPVMAFGGGRIALLNEQGSVRLWDASSGAPRAQEIETGQKHLAAMALSPDGKRLAATDDGGQVHLWDADNGRSVTTGLMAADQDPNPEARKRVSVALSGDGMRVVTGAGGDDRVREWDVATGTQIGGDMIGHQRDVTAVAFSDSGHYIASGAQDGAVRLWDADTQARVGRPLTIVQPVVNGQPATGRLYATTVVFSPGERLIVAGLNDGNIRVWPGPASWSSELCAKLLQPVSPLQWKQWVGKGIRQVQACAGLQANP